MRVLRDAGYDVFAVCEVMQRSNDTELIMQAAREQRVLLTEDKDFGWLVFVSHEASAGVILIRFPANRRGTLARAIRQVVAEHGDVLRSSFTVVQPGQIRITSKPSARYNP